MISPSTAEAKSTPGPTSLPLPLSLPTNALPLSYLETQATSHFGARMFGVLWFVIQPFLLALERQPAKRQPVERQVDGPIKRTRRFPYPSGGAGARTATLWLYFIDPGHFSGRLRSQ